MKEFKVRALGDNIEWTNSKQSDTILFEKSNLVVPQNSWVTVLLDRHVLRP